MRSNRSRNPHCTSVLDISGKSSQFLEILRTEKTIFTLCERENLRTNSSLWSAHVNMSRKWRYLLWSFYCLAAARTRASVISVIKK